MGSRTDKVNDFYRFYLIFPAALGTIDSEDQDAV
jgi:hypothetical protein